MKFTFTKTAIPDVLLIEHESFGDSRGFFAETFRENVFREAGIPPFLQESHSRSSAGILRGMHYQKNPNPQGKLVRCAKGRLWDVAVDLRRNSPYYRKWVAYELSDENHRMLWVPAGCAHGFYSLTDVDMIYKQTDYYAPELEKGFRWNDPEIGIQWPNDKPSLSPRDEKLPLFKDADYNF
ncbi:MAG: dTDP-4-dehydrorhamnose 3,5-epimerase [Elusimicrobia bacterium]|nr:dTDP-4-dehydrorhamnose 3,5-epimerase [Elusimicrobiota bacterium]